MSIPDTKSVPFFRPVIGEAEVQEVVTCLRSGWLTTGPRTRRFEKGFASAVRARHAVAVNSGTAALHLAVAALRLQPGDAVLVPTMTFAATAEVVRYQHAIPILVDCDPVTLNMDLGDAQRKLDDAKSGRLFADQRLRVVGMIPVHVGGLMMNVDSVRSFADQHGLWVVEDATHAFPAAFRRSASDDWIICGQETAEVTCFSFYPNKTMTTGEGGMAVTADAELAKRIRMMSLHGLSDDAWKRYNGTGRWDYRIVELGFKYNITDIASAIGIHQLDRAEQMRTDRERLALGYLEALSDVEQMELPPSPPHRIHAWHLFPIRLCLDRLTIDRNAFLNHLHERNIGFSVHWRPLHLHPYYKDNFKWEEAQFPVATETWKRLVSLPIFPGMTVDEQQYVVQTVRNLCREFAATPYPQTPR